MDVKYTLSVLVMVLAIQGLNGLICHLCWGPKQCFQDPSNPDYSHSTDMCVDGQVCATEKFRVETAFRVEEIIARSCMPMTIPSLTTGCLDGDQFYPDYINIMYPGVRDTATSRQGRICFCNTNLCNNQDMLFMK